MNGEIHYIAEDRKTAKNEWGNDDSDFLLTLTSVLLKVRNIGISHYVKQGWIQD